MNTYWNDHVDRLQNSLEKLSLDCNVLKSGTVDEEALDRVLSDLESKTEAVSYLNEFTNLNKNTRSSILAMLRDRIVQRDVRNG